MRCSIERSRQSLSIWAANSGRCSQSWMPGTRVSTGRNSPRISAGASGFMSHRSMWLGPPNRKMKMQAFARRSPAPGAAARKAARSRLDSPSRLSPPARSNSRRVLRGERDCGSGGENGEHRSVTCCGAPWLGIRSCESSLAAWVRPGGDSQAMPFIPRRFGCYPANGPISGQRPAEIASTRGKNSGPAL